jgi:hypothetical protein
MGRQRTENNVLVNMAGAILHCKIRNYTKNSQQIFPEKEMRGLSPNFHIHVSVSDLYIPTISLLQENMWTDPGNTISFLEYINEIFVAVCTSGIRNYSLPGQPW